MKPKLVSVLEVIFLPFPLSAKITSMCHSDRNQHLDFVLNLRLLQNLSLALHIFLKPPEISWFFSSSHTHPIASTLSQRDIGNREGTEWGGGGITVCPRREGMNDSLCCSRACSACLPPYPVSLLSSTPLLHYREAENNRGQEIQDTKIRLSFSSHYFSLCPY